MQQTLVQFLGREDSPGGRIGHPLQDSWASLVAQLVKNPPAMLGDLGLIPGLGRSPGEGKGHPLQDSGLENPVGCIVRGVTKSRTRLSDFHFHFLFFFWLRDKEFACNAGDTGLIPGSGRSFGEGNNNPRQYSCLGEPINRGL